ncbi:Flavanone 3-dioxygenase 3 [Camellia lanceoleosa]|uniref:Flavanone 3-dioxygenase 3 n=1 Tax=Camellia lanceoleosa TaxID=1840588 RepID=A0ACC0IKX2_9ERIC|nr:Flavanone 3-dioxygenase 3 [Camellia lanceoleosa]
MEVLSNGKYKSVVHRATLNLEKKRFSIASLHSLSLEKMVAPAPELVDEEHPSGYRGGNFCGFLDYISGNDIMMLGRYIDTLKKKTAVACPLGELDNRLKRPQNF